MAALVGRIGAAATIARPSGVFTNVLTASNVVPFFGKVFSIRCSASPK